MHRISWSVDILAPRDRVWSVLTDTEKRMRLHPGWEVLEFREEDAGRRFYLKVRREDGKIEERTFEVTELTGERIAYRDLEGDLAVELSVEDAPGGGVRVTQVERFSLPWSPTERTLRSMEEELKFWLEGVKHYCELRGNPIARTSKFLIDRLLLRLPPSQRRIILLIIILNAGILILFTIMFAAMKIAKMIM
jgi:uncharacterized protein YndB with AHSA1/START domain